MAFDMGSFHTRCAKSCLGIAAEHGQLAKCFGKLADDSDDDNHRNIQKSLERSADHFADLGSQHSEAAKALGSPAIDLNDDSTGIDSLKAAGVPPFGMAAALKQDELRKRLISAPSISNTPDHLSKVDSEFADLFKV